MSDTETQSHLTGPLVRLGLASLCGVVAMGLLYLREEQLVLERSGGPRTTVLVAKVNFQPGERVKAESLGTQEIPQAYLHINAISASDQDKIIGRKLYHRVRQNQPLLWTEFDPSERERANETLAKGLRLIPIVVGDQLSKSRFLSAGDALDVLVHFNLGAERGSVTTTLLQQVQVLELIGNVAMVAMTPEQLEQLVFARAHGTLTVAVRNREDIGKPTLPSVTFLTLLGNIAPAPLPSLTTLQQPPVAGGGTLGLDGLSALSQTDSSPADHYARHVGKRDAGGLHKRLPLTDSAHPPSDTGR